MLGAVASVTIGFGAIFALLPEFQDDIGFADFWLGAVTSASFLAGFVAQLCLARYADRGHGRTMLVGGVLVAALGMGGVALANDVTVLLLARIVLGLGEGAFLPAARRVVIVRNPDQLGAALGQLGSAATAGFLAGPLVAAGLAEITNLRAPFWVICVLLVALVPMLARFPVPPAEHDEVRAPLRRLISTRGVRAGMLLGASLSVAIGVYDSLWAKFLEDDHGTSVTFVGVSLFLFAMPVVILAPVMGHVADRVGPVRLGSLCAVASVPFIASYGYLPNEWFIAVFALFHSVLDSAVTPSSQSSVARASSEELVASGQGLLDGFGLLVAAVSAAVFAPLYSAFGPEVLWVVLAAAVGTAGLGAGLVGEALGGAQRTRRADTASRSRRAIDRNTARSP